MRALALLLALLASVASLTLSAQPRPADDVTATLAGVAEYVQGYFARAQSIICDETVRVQELGYDLLSAANPARIVRTELRVSWGDTDADGTTQPPQILRNLISVNGRPPRAKDRDKCFDPAETSPEVLGELFLPQNRSKFAFTSKGRGKQGGRAALLLDIRDLATGPVEVESDENCARFGKPGNVVWRAWIEPATFAVMRLDQSLISTYGVTIPANRKEHTPSRDVVVERSDTSVVYRQVSFKDPDEALFLPATRDTVQVIRDSPTPRMRISYAYRNYRRFMTGGRIVQ